MTADTPTPADTATAPIHYGPIYGRSLGETMALCRPEGSTAAMSNAWSMVTCKNCLDQRYNGKIL